MSVTIDEAPAPQLRTAEMQIIDDLDIAQAMLDAVLWGDGGKGGTFPIVDENDGKLKPVGTIEGYRGSRLERQAQLGTWAIVEGTSTNRVITRLSRRPPIQEGGPKTAEFTRKNDAGQWASIPEAEAARLSNLIRLTSEHVDLTPKPSLAQRLGAKVLGPLLTNR